MSKFPSHTSYFSIQTFLSTKTINETAIALDIIKQHYYNRDLAGENSRILTIEGYGDFISFDELCLGLWMVFDRLYWGFPQEVQEGVGLSRIGWNGEVTNPSIDIPMALQMFEELSAPATDYDDKIIRLETIEKWFYKEGTQFIEYETYDILETLNEPFYNWIEERLSDIEELINSGPDTLNKVSKDYIFDLKPTPKFYDTQYTPSDAEIGLLNEALILGNQFYLSFLTVLEQTLYTFTRKIFPLKLYATFAYLYKEYLKIIVNFVKPYHAYNLDLDPIFRIEGDINESVIVGDYFKNTIVKQLVSSIIYQLFDDDKDNGSAYDSFENIREFLKKDIELSSLIDNIFYSFRLDGASNLLIFDNNEYIFSEELRIHKNTLYEKEYTGSFPSTWKFHIPEMNKIDEEDYSSYLTWDYTTNTIANYWDRDVVLIGREKFIVGNDYTISSIEVTSDPEIRFALNFDFIQTPPKYDLRYNDFLSNCWCYNSVDGWFRKQLDYKYKFSNFDYYIRILESGDTIDSTDFMTPADVESITDFPFKIRWIRPVIIVPVGYTFTSIKFNITSTKRVYPYRNTLSIV